MVSKIEKSTEEQLNKWRLIDNGEGIHWEEIDEDISIVNLF